MSSQVVPPVAPGAQASPTEPNSAKEQQLHPVHHSWTLATTVAVIMVLLALLGVALTTSDRAIASTYWVALVPIYGLLCIGTAWLHSGPGRPFDRSAVVHQVLHWFGIGVALGLDFLVRRSGEETGVAAGLNALLVLALGCYLAGVHLEWMFAVVGALLTLTLVIVTKADQYLWLMFIVGGVTIAAMFAVRWLLHKASFGKSQPATALRPIPPKG
jgi:hypothetical protein